MIRWIGISTSKFYDWRGRYGKVNEHNGWVPRDWWLEGWEKQAIARSYQEHPLDGYTNSAVRVATGKRLDPVGPLCVAHDKPVNLQLPAKSFALLTELTPKE